MGANSVPDAHDPSKRHAPSMLTSDLALRFDPEYEKISRRFYEQSRPVRRRLRPRLVQADPSRHGPTRPLSRSGSPGEELIWQDPVPAVDHPLIDAADAAALKATILASGLTVSQLVGTAWASASTFRGSDKRGGANGARIRLAPQKDWAVNEPAQLAKVLETLDGIRKAFNDAQPAGKKVSLADLIVLGRQSAAVEQAAQAMPATTSRCPSRRAAPMPRRSRRMWSPSSYLEPAADGFRNYRRPTSPVPAEALLIDKAQLLTLTAPEMTVLVGGLRAININVDGSRNGVFTDRAGALTNDFFVNLLDMGTAWKAVSAAEGVCSKGRDRADGRAEMDRHPRRPRLRLALAVAARLGRSLCQRRCPGEVRQRLRRGLDQGDERRPLRPRLKRPADQSHSKMRGVAQAAPLFVQSFSNMPVLATMPASAPPINGATMNSQSWLIAAPPENRAGPMERAGLTDVPVTGITAK